MSSNEGLKLCWVLVNFYSFAVKISLEQAIFRYCDDLKSVDKIIFE